MSRFENRVAIVTGGARGIGAGISARLVREGAAVLVADIDADGAERLADELRSVGGRAAACAVDVTDRSAVLRLPEVARDALGSDATTLVCNAGVQTFQHALEVDDAEWGHVMDVNARGTNLCLQMAGSKLPDGSSAVVVASIQGLLPAPLYPHYAASKAAALSLVRSFALALAPRRTRVNAVAPGMVNTELWRRAGREMARLTGSSEDVQRERRIAQVPLGRPGTVDDVAAAVAFLASDDAAYITGETINVCGGDVML